MNQLRHLIFLVADHFEPDSAAQVKAWIEEYAAIASKHRDADGYMPRHTWFYWGKNRDELAELKKGCDRGLGEVEMHIHHGNDSAESLSADIRERLEFFVQAGLRQKQARIPYGFTHGYWSLDNSGGDHRCGVNNELLVLKETGCYADFTFPAEKRAQPRKYNSLYYATDDPVKPKSYDTGIDVETGKEPRGDLMIFQGPGTRSGYSRLGKVPLAQRILERTRVYSDISHTAIPTEIRVRNWVNQNIHVKGRPEWIFVKCHQHGARRADYPLFFGPAAERMYAVLEKEYNDGVAWSLHYVTAREAYNIVKAAEEEKTGNPAAYRNYLIPAYTAEGLNHD